MLYFGKVSHGCSSGTGSELAGDCGSIGEALGVLKEKSIDIVLLDFYLVYNRLQGKATPAKAMVEVVVAANDIDVGAKIGDHDLKIVKYIPDDLPTDFIRKKASVLGHGAVLPIRKGEFVLPNKLSAGPGLPALIAMGMRAEAVRVNDVTAVGGFAAPGTRVDVLATGIPWGSNEPQTEIILQDILVLAVGSKTDRNPSGEPQNATVVTLLVSPADSEKLALASQEGRVQLVLRNPADTKQETTHAMKNTDLFSGGTLARALYQDEANEACSGRSEAR